MQKRLDKVEPMYKMSEWIDDWKKNAELTEMITAYPSTTEPPSPPPTKKNLVSSSKYYQKTKLLLSRSNYCRELKRPLQTRYATIVVLIACIYFNMVFFLSSMMNDRDYTIYSTSSIIYWNYTPLLYTTKIIIN